MNSVTRSIKHAIGIFALFAFIVCLPLMAQNAYADEGNHTWSDEPTIDKAPTCTDFGKQTFHCTTCDAVMEELIPPLGHQWNTTYTVDVPATESAPGSQSIHCTRCGAVKEGSAQIIPQLPPDEIIVLKTIKISKLVGGKKALTVKWKKLDGKARKKISGIQIQVATDSNFTNIVKTATVKNKKTSKKFKGLQSKTKYYVRIRAFAAGNQVSLWKTKRVKVK